MTMETFEKAEKIHKRIADAGYFIDNAKRCNGIRILCNGEGFNVCKSTLEVIIEALSREKEKWEKEMEAL